jgi:hypothetical protein
MQDGGWTGEFPTPVSYYERNMLSTVKNFQVTTPTAKIYVWNVAYMALSDRESMEALPFFSCPGLLRARLFLQVSGNLAPLRNGVIQRSWTSTMPLCGELFMQPPRKTRHRCLRLSIWTHPF